MQNIQIRHPTLTFQYFTFGAAGAVICYEEFFLYSCDYIGSNSAHLVIYVTIMHINIIRFLILIFKSVTSKLIHFETKML